MMRHYLVAIAVLLISINFLQQITPAPGEAQHLQASILDHLSQNNWKKQISTADKPENTDLLRLLEIYEEKRDSEALSILERTGKNDKNQKLLELFEAKIAARSLQFEEAARLLDHVNHEEAILLKAVVLIAMGDRERAEAFLRQIIDENPQGKNRFLALSLLNIYHSFDQHRDANQSYLLVLFAQKLGELGEYEIAQYLTERAIEEQPNYRDAWLIKGYTEFQLKNFPAAEKALLEANQLDPSHPQIQYLLGMTYFELKQPRLSSEFLLYAQQNNSAHQKTIAIKLGENSLELNEPALAAHHYQEALAFDLANKEVLTRLVWIYAELLGQYQDAEEHARTLISAHPNDPEGRRLLSWIQSKRNL